MTGRRSAQDEDLRNGGAVRFRRLVEFEVRDFAVAVRGFLVVADPSYVGGEEWLGRPELVGYVHDWRRVSGGVPFLGEEQEVGSASFLPVQLVQKQDRPGWRWHLFLLLQ